MKKIHLNATLCNCINQHLLTPTQACPQCGAWVQAASEESQAEDRYSIEYFEALEASEMSGN